MDGICTLANDRVYDQAIALLNSIEAIYGTSMPICIYPYDENIEQLAAAIDDRPQVQLYDNRASIEAWDHFVHKAWDTHPTARQRWQQAGSSGYHRVGTHRRYCAFDGPFDRFIYMDADTLLMAPLDRIFAQLHRSDFVVYDFQYKDPTHVYDLSSPKLTEVFSEDRIASEIFCSGFYGSKKGCFEPDKRDWFLNQLSAQEGDILYPMAPDQTLLNYMVMRSRGVSSYNFALNLSPNQRTGCCVTSSHFEEKEQILYDGGKRLTYLHYIGISSQIFTRLCAGDNIDFPYRDLFLHYRYFHAPETQPPLKGKPKPYNSKSSFAKSALKKLVQRIR